MTKKATASNATKLTFTRMASTPPSMAAYNECPASSIELFGVMVVDVIAALSDGQWILYPL
ncbi:hypothetical protein P3T76_006847 [Phytophthora citrophthora]|uniref:Uncharacterized protein n=1 Tax=Phytophthora citrophthora TaxID=4793 RepID=A0AAD9LLV8_9STRA|nr:hypothetical protein P3T76_006847 [Phytophthora citrophthora]